jgi:hypothetical protein
MSESQSLIDQQNFHQALSFAINSWYNAAQINNSDDNSCMKILWAEFRQRLKTVSTAAHADVLKVVELILLTMIMTCKAEKSITSWLKTQWILLSNLMRKIWIKDRAHQLKHRKQKNYFVAERLTKDEAWKIMCNTNLYISLIDWQTQLYDFIEQCQAQIMFQIREIMKNHYVFYEKLNTSNYVVSLLNNDNFISSDIEKINIFTDVICWLTCT